MMSKDIDFPQYRKLSNEKVFYKILSDRKFIEIQRMGSKAFLYEFDIIKYPEILKIQDMLSLEESYLQSNKLEFETLIDTYSL